MYTEENEFNYNDYLDESENYKRPIFDFKFILKIIIIILLIILIIYLIFKIKNRNTYNPSKPNGTNTFEISESVFNDNFKLVRETSLIHFFDNNHLPKGVGDFDSITIDDLVEEKLVTEVSDERGNLCNYNTSGANIIKNKHDYQVEVKLNCSGLNKEETYYYNEKGVCLNCNGEKYVPNNDDDIDDIINEIEKNNDTKTNTDTNNNNFNDDSLDKVPNNNDNTSQETETNREPVLVCKDFSDWTTEVKTDTNLEWETRTVVKGYKEDITYGEWSSPTTNKIEANSTLEVKSYDDTSTSSYKSCSGESTTKPKSKSGRTITSRKKKITTTKKVCTGGSTYTKTLKKWDYNAYSCRVVSIGKVVCTYKTEKKCTNKKVDSTVTYYKYCDTKYTSKTVTYYQSRSINKNTTYTDYILESEMPEGYTKLNGSDTIQYRYREKCVNK